MRLLVFLICMYLCQPKVVQNGEESCTTTTLSSVYSPNSLDGHVDTWPSTNSWRVSVNEPPNIKLFVAFPKKISIHGTDYVNLLVELGPNSPEFGLLILNDSTGKSVDNILHQTSPNRVEANRVIAYEWLKGNGLKPVTWYTLIQVLKMLKLMELVDMIRDSVSEWAMNATGEGLYYSVETTEFIETLRSTYEKEDLFDPDLWLTQYLPRVKYLNLTLEENGQETNLYQIVDDLQSDSGKRILLTGRPGVGKTTLLRCMSKLWATKDSEVLLGCKLLLKIPLGNVTTSVPDDLTHFLKVALRGEAKHIESLVRDLKINKGRGACILLDAYDELKTDSARMFIRDLLTNGVREMHLPKANYVITSRSVSSSDLKIVTDRTIEVVGISETQLQLFIESLSQDEQQLLNRFFNKQPNAKHLCHIPLYLSMVVFTVLGSEVIHSSSSFIETETDLFTSFVGLTLEQYRKNRHPDWNRFSLWKCSFSEEASEKQCEGFQALCSAAFQSVFRYQVTVRVDVTQGVLAILERDFVLDTDIMESVREDITLVMEIAKDKVESRDVIRFSFIDGSYNEFVQALHLAGLPKQETTELHNLVGKGKVTEEHVCSGYVDVCSAVYELLAQGTDGPPINILDILHERSPDGKMFGYEPIITDILKDLSLVKITRTPTVYGEVLQFTFPHKTFQEFLSALYLSSLPEHEKLAYIALYGKEVEFELVFQFLFGLARDSSNSNISKLLEWYSSYKYADHRNVVLKVARETKLEGKPYQNLMQESGALINSSLCIQIKERDDCLSARYALKHVPVQKLGIHLTLLKSSCMYYSVHSAKEVHLTVDCPMQISSYNYLRKQISPAKNVVTYLSVQRCLLVPEEVLAFSEQLKTLTQLQTLHLIITTDITPDGAVALFSALQSLPRLHSLQLEMEVMCSGTRVLITTLKQLKQLRHLTLTLQSTDEKTLEPLRYRRQQSCWKYGEDFHCPYQPFIDCFCSIHNVYRHMQYGGSTSKLATIFLSGNCSDNQAPVDYIFSHLGSMEHLETLILPISFDLDGDITSIELFSNRDKLHNLKHLDLSYNFVSDSNSPTLNYSRLQFLDIGHTGWKPDTLIKGLISAHDLRIIKFTDSRSETDAAVSSLKHLQHLQHLQAIILDFSNVNDSHIPILSKYITNMQSLRVLDLGCNKITSGGLKMLVETLHHLQHFHHLDLSYNEVSMINIESSLDSLRYLSLAGNGLGADSAQALAVALKYLPSVVHLDLSNNQLTSDGVLTMVRELHFLFNLRYLDLSYNQLRFELDEVHELAEGLKRIETLKYLSLAGNKLSLDSTKVLANHLQHIDHLDLSDIANQLSLQ